MDAPTQFANPIRKFELWNFRSRVLLLPLALSTTQHFYAPQLVPAGTAEARISYGDSVRLSQAGAEPSPGEIETPGLHHMVAWSI